MPAAAFQTPGLRRRMACWLYEGLVLFALMMIAVLIESVIAIAIPAFNHPLVLQLGSLLLFGCYFAWFWSRGQTLPMKTWRIQIVDANGRRLTVLRAWTRYAFSWIWVLPLAVQLTPWHLPMDEMLVLLGGWILIWALLSRFHPQHQFLHDALAGTRLIHANP